MTDDLGLICYPALAWSTNYAYLASSRLELCAHPRSLFADSVSKARAGGIQLVDAGGRYFKIIDWRPVKPFGGIKGFTMQLLGTIFAAPVLTNEVRLTVSEYKKKLEYAMTERYKYDDDNELLGSILDNINKADSYRCAIDMVPGR